MRIIIDVHEPIEIYERLIREGIPVDRRKISPGDIIVGDIGIERKTTYDFFNSLIKKRLFEQVGRLRDAYPKALIILEGDLDQIYEYKNYRAYLGAMLSVAIDFDVPIIYSRDLLETTYLVSSIWRKKVKEKPTGVVRYKPKFMDDDEFKLYVLQGLPNIGPKLAHRLLLRFKTIRNVFTSTVADLKDVEGIGEKKAKEIVRLINEPYGKGLRDEG